MQVRENWPGFGVVFWYSKKRGIKMPKTRCHYGEILCLYTPAYVFLGLSYKLLSLVFKAVRAIIKLSLWIVRWPLFPIWVPTAWFVKRVAEEFRRKNDRAVEILALSLVLLLVAQIATVAFRGLADPSTNTVKAFLLISMASAFFGTIIFGFLAVWSWDALGPRVKPLIALAKEASETMQRPSLKKVEHFGAVPFKLIGFGLKFGWEFGTEGVSLTRNGWRRWVCPKIEYIDKDGNPFDPDVLLANNKAVKNW